MNEEVGKLTGLPLSRYATAELIARARAAGFDTLWAYVEHLEKDNEYWRGQAATLFQEWLKTSDDLARIVMADLNG